MGFLGQVGYSFLENILNHTIKRPFKTSLIRKLLRNISFDFSGIEFSKNTWNNFHIPIRGGKLTFRTKVTELGGGGGGGERIRVGGR